MTAVSAEVRAHADREHRRKAIRAARGWLGALIVGAVAWVGLIMIMLGVKAAEWLR